MKDLTIIIPIHKSDDEAKRFLKNAYQSILDMNGSADCVVSVVGPISVLDVCKDACPNSNIAFIENKGETDFFTQVNLAVSKCKTKYFSILEMDDEYAKHWAENVVKYIEYRPDVSVFLPLTEIYDKDEKFLQFMNEVALASSFTDEIEFLDLESLQTYMEFNVTGAVIKTEVFKEFGPLKKSLKIAAWYEFLLRMCQNNQKVMTIPKVGYRHMVGRDESYMDEAQKTIAPEEADWLIKTAQQEYFFKEDRNKIFSGKIEKGA